MVVGLLFLFGMPVLSARFISSISLVKCRLSSPLPLTTDLETSFPREANMRQALRLLPTQGMACVWWVSTMVTGDILFGGTF